MKNVLHWQGSSEEGERARSPSCRATTGSGGGEGLAPVCVGIVDGMLRAEIARTYLEQAGIVAYLQADSAASVYGFTTGPLGAVRVCVPASQAEEAAQVFAELDLIG